MYLSGTRVAFKRDTKYFNDKAKIKLKMNGELQEKQITALAAAGADENQIAAALELDTISVKTALKAAAEFSQVSDLSDTELELVKRSLLQDGTLNPDPAVRIQVNKFLYAQNHVSANVRYKAKNEQKTPNILLVNQVLNEARQKAREI